MWSDMLLRSILSLFLILLRYSGIFGACQTSGIYVVKYFHFCGAGFLVLGLVCRICY